MLRLTVSDGAVTVSDDVTITVNPIPPNTAPVVNAGADRTITLPASTTLAATATDDGRPSPPAQLTRSWTKVSGPGTVTFSSTTSLTPTVTFSAAGAYVLRLTVSDSVLTTSDDIAVTVNAATATGLTARYYRDPGTGAHFATLTVTRVDSTVNFNWGTAAPAAGVTADNFSVRWTGRVQAPVTGTYRFSTVSDDGIRLWINGQQVINNWTDHASTTNTSAAISLTAGVRYTVTLEYYEKGGECGREAAVVLPRTVVAGDPGVAVVPVIGGQPLSRPGSGRREEEAKHMTRHGLRNPGHARDRVRLRARRPGRGRRLTTSPPSPRKCTARFSTRRAGSAC